MPFATRLTARLSLAHPVISAPMAMAAGGALAGAVSAAGGLGLIGGGYGDAGWIEEQFDAAGNQPVGCGFITWSLRKSPHLLDIALERRPKAVCLSFDDPEPFASRIRAEGIPLDMPDPDARRCRPRHRGRRRHRRGAGCRGGRPRRRARGALTLVPEVADLIARRSPETLLCAAGGIADGRGLAAALMLGADGVLMGSRFWASREALVPAAFHRTALAADGDQTIQSSVMDIARELDWPDRFRARVLRNPFTDRWHGREDELRANAAEEAARWRDAWTAGDPAGANVFIGEAVGLIDAIEPAGEILANLITEAEEVIRRRARLIAG